MHSNALEIVNPFSLSPCSELAQDFNFEAILRGVKKKAQDIHTKAVKLK